jgi:hypothetical protein
MDVPTNPLTHRPPWAPADAPPGSTQRPRSKARLGRLRSMSLTEIAYRSRQEASKALERLAPVRPIVDAKAWLESHAPSLANDGASLQVIRDRAPRRFFAGVSEPHTADALAARFPVARRQTLRSADAVLEGRFDLLGYEGLSFGDPIDWHLDPVWSRRAPLAHWSRLDPLDPAVVGDSKIVWELNRHQWLVRLAQAWTLSGEPRYAAACLESIDAWREANPRGIGVNWASSLEVSFRLMSWCWAVLLIRDAPALSSRWAMSFLTAIWQHADHIQRYLSYYSSPNTHLTGEALGLFYAGTLFPEFSDAAHWRSVATRVLLAECTAQLPAEGIHVEQSTCYHRYTVDTYLQLVLLATRNRVTLPHEVVEQVERMMDFLVALRRPDGTIPAIGDDDGGELLPLVERRQGDSRGTFAIAAALFNRADFAWAAEGVAPELFWLMGGDGVRAFDALHPAPPPETRASRIFSGGGYAVMRSGWAADAHQLIADVGPLGCPTSSGHGHADLLSVQCAIFGEPCLVDAGTYCYTADPLWRDFFRGTAAHSTVRVDGLDQAQTAGPFRWLQRPKARLRSWESDQDADILDAEHAGYQRLPDPVTCRRRVIFVKPDYWLIVDDIDGAADHRLEVTFQFAPTVRIAAGCDGWVRAETPGGRALWMLTVASTPVQTTVACGELEPIRGWISPDYGQRQPAPALVISAAATLPWRALTLLLPDGVGASSPPRVTPTCDGEGRPDGVTFEPPRRSVRVDARTVVIR